MNTTKKRETLEDERILAEIICAHERSGRRMCPSTNLRVVPGTWEGYGVSEQASCSCAVGTGLIYSQIDRDDLVYDPLRGFAKHYGVTVDYAVGVSDGFEEGLACQGRRISTDYQRGLAVGNAAFEYVRNDLGYVER